MLRNRIVAALVAVPLVSLGRIAAGAGLTGIWRALGAPDGHPCRACAAAAGTVTPSRPTRRRPRLLR